MVGKSWEVELWWPSCRQAIQRVACNRVCGGDLLQPKVQLHMPGQRLGLSPFLPPCVYRLQERLMSERNSIIASNNNRHAKERAVLERQQEKLQVRCS